MRNESGDQGTMGKRLTTRVVVAISALALVTGACGGSSSQTQSPAAQSRSQAPPPKPVPPNVCELMTTAEAAVVLGQPVRPGVREFEPSRPSLADTCVFGEAARSDFPMSVTVGVSTLSSSRATVAQIKA